MSGYYGDLRGQSFRFLSDGLASAASPGLYRHLVDATFGDYVMPPHLSRLVDALEAVARGEITRLMVFMPPRHGKTLTVCGFASWMLRYYRGRRLIYVSHTDALATEKSNEVQRMFEAVGGQFRGGATRVNKGAWETDTGGSFRALGTGAGLTGSGGDVIILDDPIKDSREAHSLVVQRAKWDWFNSTFMTRRNPAVGQSGRSPAAVIIIMTLWSVHDIPLKIMEAERRLALNPETAHLTEPWTVLDFPALATPIKLDFPQHFDVLPDWRADGDPLCEEFASRADLERIRARYAESGASWVWDSLYQQTPIPAEGVHIKRSWFGEYRPKEDLPRFIRWFRPWDLAFTKDGGDRTVSALCGIDNNRHYWIIPDTSVQCSAPDVRDLIASTAMGDPPNTQYGIERKHAGLAIIDDLKREGPLSNRFIYESVPHRSKIERCANWAAKAQAGEVHIVADTHASRLMADEMMSSFTTFRGEDGDFDDWVDMVSILDEMAALTYGQETESGLPLSAAEYFAGITNAKKPRQKKDFGHRGAGSDLQQPDGGDSPDSARFAAIKQAIERWADNQRGQQGQPGKSGHPVAAKPRRLPKRLG